METSSTPSPHAPLSPQNGCYLARALSYEGVTFEHVHVNISKDFRGVYDAAADLWLRTAKLANSEWAKLPPPPAAPTKVRFLRQRLLPLA